MALTLTTTQFVEGSLQAVDSRGRAVPVQSGSVIIESSDESVFVVERNPENETSFRIVAVGEGVAQLNYSADADRDDDEIRTISGFTAVEVQASEAIGFGGIVFGAPQEQDFDENDGEEDEDGGDDTPPAQGTGATFGIPIA